MKHLGLDFQISRIIKMVRELKGIQQKNVAAALHTDPSTYSRIEKGEISITPAQLEIISESLEVALFEIMALAKISIGFIKQNHTYPEIISQIPEIFVKINGLKKLNYNELHFIIGQLGVSADIQPYLSLSNKIAI